MTNQNSQAKYLSKCCNREVIEQHGCDADSGHGKKECNCEIVTTWYECFACKEPCDAYIITVAGSTPEQPVTFETATSEQKKELVRECVKEANQDQRDMVKKATDLEKLIDDARMRLCAEGDDETVIYDLLRKAYKAGARGHAETVKCCATPHSTELSDQFFNNLNI